MAQIRGVCVVDYSGMCVLTGAQPGFFGTGEVSWNGSTSINVSCAPHKRTKPQGKILVLFCPRCS